MIRNDVFPKRLDLLFCVSDLYFTGYVRETGLRKVLALCMHSLLLWKERTIPYDHLICCWLSEIVCVPLSVFSCTFVSGFVALTHTLLSLEHINIRIGRISLSKDILLQNQLETLVLSTILPFWYTTTLEQLMMKKVILWNSGTCFDLFTLHGEE